MNLERDLIEAAKQGLKDEIQPLLDLGAYLRTDGDAALREAAMKGKLEIVQLLLRKYPDTDSMKQAIENLDGYLTIARFALITIKHEVKKEVARRGVSSSPGIDI